MERLLCRRPFRRYLLVESLARARRSFTAQPRARRELLYFGLALLFGLLVVPVLTWLIGSRVLGPYSRGTEVHSTPLALLRDFFSGLVHGYVIFWIVALGPIVFLLLIRIVLALLRRPAKPDENGHRV
jgi:uncharacterized membrane protein YedE/YeeE